MMPDPAERALAMQDTFERAIKGPDHHAGARRDSGDHGEEAYLVHGAPEAANPKPYRWKARGVDILAKIHRARLALHSAESCKAI